jgi:hypothetical protein
LIGDSAVPQVFTLQVPIIPLLILSTVASPLHDNKEESWKLGPQDWLEFHAVSTYGSSFLWCQPYWWLTGPAVVTPIGRHT